MFARCADREARPEAPGLLLIGVADPSVAFDRRPGTHAITGECCIMSGLSRRGFIGSAAAGLAAAEADQTDFVFKNNVPDEILAGHELPTFKFEAGEVDGGQGRRREQRAGGDRQATADLEGDRRRLDAAGARRIARAALARHGGRVGLRRRRTRAHHGHRSRRGTSRSMISAPATSGTSPAGTGTPSTAWGRAPRTSS